MLSEASELGDEAAGLHAGDRARKPDGLNERAELLLDGVGESVDVLVEEVQMGEDGPDHQGVMRLEATLKRLAQGGQLLTQPATGRLGEDHLDR